MFFVSLERYRSLMPTTFSGHLGTGTHHVMDKSTESEESEEKLPSEQTGTNCLHCTHINRLQLGVAQTVPVSAYITSHVHCGCNFTCTYPKIDRIQIAFTVFLWLNNLSLLTMLRLSALEINRTPCGRSSTSP